MAGFNKTRQALRLVSDDANRKYSDASPSTTISPHPPHPALLFIAQVLERALVWLVVAPPRQSLPDDHQTGRRSNDTDGKKQF